MWTSSDRTAALRVQDEYGVWSEWETVDFQNIPGDSIHIELTWDHPSSDVDLHLLRGGDRTGYTGRDDCYYANCKPALDGSRRLAWGPGGRRMTLSSMSMTSTVRTREHQHRPAGGRSGLHGGGPLLP